MYIIGVKRKTPLNINKNKTTFYQNIHIQLKVKSNVLLGFNIVYEPGEFLTGSQIKKIFSKNDTAKRLS